jgi:hypothetical protein
MNALLQFEAVKEHAHAFMMNKVHQYKGLTSEVVSQETRKTQVEMAASQLGVLNSNPHYDQLNGNMPSLELQKACPLCFPASAPELGHE